MIHGSVEDHFALAPVALALTAGPTHELVYANGAFLHLLAIEAIALGHDGNGASRTAADLVPLLDRAFQRTQPFEEIVRSPRPGCAPWNCTVWPVSAAPDGPREIMIEVRDVSQAEGARVRQRAITERLLLGALNDQDAARDAEDAGRNAVHLADVSRRLSISLDEGETRDAIRRLTLPRPGVWCIVDVVESNGAIHRLPPIHPDTAKQSMAEQLADQSVTADGIPMGVRSVLASARPMVLTPDDDRALTVVAQGDEKLRLLREIGFGALLVVPLITRARVEGTITFVNPEGQDSFSTEEIALATDLGSRCALALENARLYREAETLRQAADLANQSKTQFLSSMSHELRTPLNAIGGFVELLDLAIPGPVTPKQHEALARIKANQELLLALITEILNFARIDSGRIEYHFGEVSLQQALANVGEMLSGAMVEKNIARKGPRDDVDATAWADADRVRQILVNLVMNAVKYSQSGATISLECDSDEQHAIARVSDTGPGVPAPKLATIFEPFVQLTPGLANQRGGVGLGLAISRDLARAMGGDLKVESTVGIGSRFTLVLPKRPNATSGGQGTVP